jgi:signal transduction histidine kinase
LATLAEDGALSFDAGSASWRWTRDAVARRAFTENVVEFMVGKLERLPEASTQALKWLACAGSSAPPVVLTMISREIGSDVVAALEAAVRAGLISSKEQGYEFLHDRVQEAVYSSVPEAERAARHLGFARLLARESLAASELNDAIFQVVDQFRRAGALLVDVVERREVAALNVTAAARARGSAAYGVALSCLTAAAELLPADAWEGDYAFKFQLELRRAESLLLTGESCVDGMLEALARRARGQVDAAAVTCLRAGRYVAANRLELASSVCVEYLAGFGQDITPHPTDADVLGEYTALRAALARREVRALSELPVATSPEWLAMMSVFEALLPAAAFSDRNMFDWAALRVVNLSIEHGNSVQSSIAYSHMALTLSARFDDPALAYQFGEVARVLVERPGFERYHARVLVVLAYHVLPWTGPLWEALAVMRRTKHEAFEQGDFTYVGFAGVHLVQLGIAAASPLDEVLADARAELDFVRRADFGFIADCHASLLGLILALRGEEPPPTAGDERDAALPAVPIALCWHWSRRMQASVLFGDFVEALRCKREAERLIDTSKTHYDFAEFNFFGGLSEAVAGELESARAHLELVTRWAERSSATFASRASLLAAEIASREGRALDAQRSFESCVVQARASGLLHDEALGNERAAQFHEASGFHTAAGAFRAAARHCYARWGALGKLQQLERDHAGAGPTNPGLVGQIGNLDVTTIVEMSRAISGEIDLDRMVERLVALGTNHAAATRGLLVLPGARGFRIEAEARSGAEPSVLFRRCPVSARELPESILRYVTRTLRPVVLDDASKPSPFAADPYLQASGVRSLFCLPLLKQGKLAGVLYLENALVPGAFTHHRVEVLQLLGSQAAVSLENATLFANLRRAELALSEAQRLSQTGSFRLSVASGELELSHEACRIYGFELGGRVSVEAYFSRIHPEDRPRLRAELEQRLSQKQGFRAEHRLLLPNGTLKHVRLLAHVLQGDAEAPSELLGAVMDVTAAKRAEESEALAKADLAHATRVTTMVELTASLAHEIKQPITAALTNAGATVRWLGREPPDLDEARAAVARMVRDATRASDIVGRISMLFRKRALPHEPIDVRELIRDTILILRSEAGRHAIEIGTELAAELPRPMADRVQLQQVLVNLIMNGIDATKDVDGPRELLISAQPAEGKLFVSVSDTGAGFPSSDADKIFNAFYTTKDHGTGMGLAISRSIVESLGGRLWATAGSARGATFHFSLPVSFTGG